MCGGRAVWASEVEPYPIAVTRTHLPHMKHLGSVKDVRGDKIEPVDIITFRISLPGLEHCWKNAPAWVAEDLGYSGKQSESS